MTSPSISFVVPAHNEALLLGPALESIFAEIAREGIDAEVVVVDNASTDATPLIADWWRATVVREQRKGVVFAREAGRLATTREWIANVDADSEIPPGWLAAALPHLADPDVAAVSGPLAFRGLSAPERVFIWAFYLTARWSHRHVGPMLQGGNCLIRRSAIEAAGGYDVSVAFYGEDTRTACLLSAAGDVRYERAMWVWSSPRRLRVEGFAVTAWRYMINYLSVTLRGKPVTREYGDVRR